MLVLAPLAPSLMKQVGAPPPVCESAHMTIVQALDSMIETATNKPMSIITKMHRRAQEWALWNATN